MKLEGAAYKIIYNNKDITRDISDHLISLSYTDKVEGESDEMEIELDDKEALWQNEWYPVNGDTVQMEIDDSGSVLACGKFTIDEKKFSFSKDGDAVTISGLAAAFTKKLRSKKSTAHENKTLKQLAQAVASFHGLSLQGVIPNIQFGRVTQNRESDLSFLNRISQQYGLIFSVRDDKLVFTSSFELESKAHVLTIDKTGCEAAEFTDKSESTYKSVSVAYHNPEKAETIKKTVETKVNPNAQYLVISKPFLEGHTNLDPALDVPPDYMNGQDDLALYGKVENERQAEMMATTIQRKVITKVQTCSISVKGNPLLVSGVNVELTGFGKVSGIYHITESSHKLDRSGGYLTSFEAKKVNPVAPAKYKPIAKKKLPQGIFKTSDVVTGPARVDPTVRRLGGGTRLVND